MGIKFLCPNGHKLNVKTFLAGKRGICPHCGASFDIPLASTRGSGTASEPAEAEQGEGIIDQGANSPQSAIPVAVRAAGGIATANVPEIAGEAAYHPSIHPAANPALAEQAPAYQPAAHVPQTPANSADPIAEAPQANWYVRPPTGGQYGPAPGDIMRRWVTEGRVSVDSLIWREGWAEWQTAGAVFSSTFAGAQAAAPAATETSTAARATLPVLRRRKKAKSLPWFMIVLLGVAFIASIIIIVKVLN